MSGTDQANSSSSRFASPQDSRTRKTPIDSMQESTSDQLLKSRKRLSGKPGELLRDGCVVALYARDIPGLLVARQRVKGGGWFLDTMSNVMKRDAAAQFLIVIRSKNTIGLRSFAAGGKLLQINRRMEFVFATHSLVAMNPNPYQPMAPPPPWARMLPPNPPMMPPNAPMVPPNPPVTSTFWETANVRDQLKNLQDTLGLAKAMQKELEMLMLIRDGKGSDDASVSGFSEFLEDRKIDLEAQVLQSVEAANSLMAKLRVELEPFRVITHEMCPWEEKSAAVQLSNKICKSKRNKQRRKRKRKHIAEMFAKVVFGPKMSILA